MRSSGNLSAIFNVMRYSSADDFGLPETAFLICRFWLIDALWAIGRKEDARDMFVDALKLRNSYGLMSEDVHPATQGTVGQFPADLFDGGHDPERDPAVAKLGGPVLARLVVVSNRVAVPDGKSGGRAGGLEVAVKAALRHREGVWFGWSGKIARKGEATETTTVHHDNIDYVATNLGAEDYKEYYNGFANRVLWPVLHYRFDLAEFSRRDLSGYMRVNEHFATRARQAAAARRRRLGARLSPDPAREDAARARPPATASAISCTFPVRRRRC